MVSGGGGGCRADMKGGRRDVEGKGTELRAGETVDLGGLENGSRCVEGICVLLGGRRTSREGRSLSRGGCDVSEVGTVDGVRARSDELRGMLGGGVGIDGARLTNGDCGGAGGSLRADESAAERLGSVNGTGKGGCGEGIRARRLALEGVLTRCKAGGMASRTGVETRSGGGGVRAGAKWGSSGKEDVFGRGTLVAFGVLPGGGR